MKGQGACGRAGLYCGRALEHPVPTAGRTAILAPGGWSALPCGQNTEQVPLGLAPTDLALLTVARRGLASAYHKHMHARTHGPLPPFDDPSYQSQTP